MGRQQSSAAARSVAKQVRRRKRQCKAARSPLGRTQGTDPVIRWAPLMPVTEYQQRTASGELLPATDFEPIDPALGRALKRRHGRWIDPGYPPNSLWELKGSADPDLEFSQGLCISVTLRDDAPCWLVYYPSPDEMSRPADEVFTTREDLLESLDRLESFAGRSPGTTAHNDEQ